MGNQRYLSPTVPMNPCDLSVGDGPDWKVNPRCTANHIETQPEHTKTSPKQPLLPPFPTGTLWPVEVNVELVGVPNIPFYDKYGVEGLF